ncbi:MAG: M14 family metallopeptidase [Phycisphaerales bacterium]|jgi:hypothetical protein|nr:M14 family metallopeptidase [Phycisphaerales bacterium]
MIIRLLLLLAALTTAAHAQYPHESRVDLRFDHWYDYEDMTRSLHRLVTAYPELLSIETIGKSVGGRDLWLVTLNNPKTGTADSKTAMFIDGNIHGNEIQAAETVLYSIWYLCKSYGVIDRITRLVDERAFYFVPMENPDGREVWFHEPSTPHYLRGGIKPTDNDHDGLYDEDPPDDLDGDGHITQMWVRDPLGRYMPDPDDPRFFKRVDRDDAPGGWSRAGQEGIDNDDDGRTNEDGPGGYDPNRNWPNDWQPQWIQYGADDYPFSLPETRAVGEFVYNHPNIAAYQSYHNAGGMILFGPNAPYVKYPESDLRVYREIADKGAEMLPFYDPMTVHSDLYVVHGGEDGFTYEGLGIISFTNELWTDKRMMADGSNPSTEQRRTFRDLLQFEDVYVPYHEVQHPTYGTVLVGGQKKFSSRVTPPWMLEEGCHRNFAFTMYHADQMPLLRWGALRVRELQDGLWEVTAEVVNDRLIPTRTSMAARNKIGLPDFMHCTTDSRGSVVASGTVSSLLPTAKLEATDTPQPDRISNNSGIGGQSGTLFRFLIEGNGTAQLRYAAQKGGTIERSIQLVEQSESRPIIQHNAIPDDTE